MAEKEQVEGITRTPNGEYKFNLSSTLANDDWLHALRLQKAKEFEELRKMENTIMYTQDLEE